MNELQRVKQSSLNHNGDTGQATDDVHTVEFAHDRIMDIMGSKESTESKSMQVYSVLADMFEDIQ